MTLQEFEFLTVLKQHEEEVIQRSRAISARRCRAISQAGQNFKDNFEKQQQEETQQLVEDIVPGVFHQFQFTNLPNPADAPDQVSIYLNIACECLDKVNKMDPSLAHQLEKVLNYLSSDIRLKPQMVDDLNLRIQQLQAFVVQQQLQIQEKDDQLQHFEILRRDEVLQLEAAQEVAASRLQEIQKIQQQILQDETETKKIIDKYITTKDLANEYLHQRDVAMKLQNEQLNQLILARTEVERLIAEAKNQKIIHGQMDNQFLQFQMEKKRQQEEIMSLTDQIRDLEKAKVLDQRIQFQQLEKHKKKLLEKDDHIEQLETHLVVMQAQLNKANMTAFECEQKQTKLRLEFDLEQRIKGKMIQFDGETKVDKIAKQRQEDVQKESTQDQEKPKSKRLKLKTNAELDQEDQLNSTAKEIARQQIISLFDSIRNDVLAMSVDDQSVKSNEQLKNFLQQMTEQFISSTNRSMNANWEEIFDNQNKLIGYTNQFVQTILSNIMLQDGVIINNTTTGLQDKDSIFDQIVFKDQDNIINEVDNTLTTDNRWDNDFGVRPIIDQSSNIKNKSPQRQVCVLDQLNSKKITKIQQTNVSLLNIDLLKVLKQYQAQKTKLPQVQQQNYLHKGNIDKLVFQQAELEGQEHAHSMQNFTDKFVQTEYDYVQPKATRNQSKIKGLKQDKQQLSSEKFKDKYVAGQINTDIIGDIQQFQLLSNKIIVYLTETLSQLKKGADIVAVQYQIQQHLKAIQGFEGLVSNQEQQYLLALSSHIVRNSQYSSVPIKEIRNAAQSMEGVSLISSKFNNVLDNTIEMEEYNHAMLEAIEQEKQKTCSTDIQIQVIGVNIDKQMESVIKDMQKDKEKQYTSVFETVATAKQNAKQFLITKDNIIIQNRKNVAQSRNEIDAQHKQQLSKTIQYSLKKSSYKDVSLPSVVLSSQDQIQQNPTQPSKIHNMFVSQYTDVKMTSYQSNQQSKKKTIRLEEIAKPFSENTVNSLLIGQTSLYGESTLQMDQQKDFIYQMNGSYFFSPFAKIIRRRAHKYVHKRNQKYLDRILINKHNEKAMLQQALSDVAFEQQMINRKLGQQTQYITNNSSQINPVKIVNQDIQIEAQGLNKDHEAVSQLLNHINEVNRVNKVVQLSIDFVVVFNSVVLTENDELQRCIHNINLLDYPLRELNLQKIEQIFMIGSRQTVFTNQNEIISRHLQLFADDDQIQFINSTSIVYNNIVMILNYFGVKLEYVIIQNISYLKLPVAISILSQHVADVAAVSQIRNILHTFSSKNIITESFKNPCQFLIDLYIQKYGKNKLALKNLLGVYVNSLNFIAVSTVQELFLYLITSQLPHVYLQFILWILNNVKSEELDFNKAVDIFMLVFPFQNDSQITKVFRAQSEYTNTISIWDLTVFLLSAYSSQQLRSTHLVLKIFGRYSANDSLSYEKSISLFQRYFNIKHVMSNLQYDTNASFNKHDLLYIFNYLLEIQFSNFNEITTIEAIQKLYSQYLKIQEKLIKDNALVIDDPKVVEESSQILSIIKCYRDRIKIGLEQRQLNVSQFCFIQMKYNMFLQSLVIILAE